jgi:hypothetical protein
MTTTSAVSSKGIFVAATNSTNQTISLSFLDVYGLDGCVFILNIEYSFQSKMVHVFCKQINRVKSHLL